MRAARQESAAVPESYFEVTVPNDFHDSKIRRIQLPHIAQFASWFERVLNEEVIPDGVAI